MGWARLCSVQLSSAWLCLVKLCLALLCSAGLFSSSDTLVRSARLSSLAGLANPHTSECDCSSRHARGTRPSPAREKSTQSLRMASPHLIPILYSRPTRELPRPSAMRGVYEMIRDYMRLYGIIHGLHMDRIAGQLWSCRGHWRYMIIHDYTYRYVS